MIDEIHAMRNLNDVKKEGDSEFERATDGVGISPEKTSEEK